MTLTLSEVMDMTSLEIARAMATAGAPLSRYDDLMRLAARGAEGDAAPDDVLLAMTLEYALAWQYRLRDEPGVTWAEAQTWRVTMDYGDTTADAISAAEAEASVGAALLTGLPPAEASKLTMRELGEYNRRRAG